ncbi:thermonuclease family protein [Candidatus Saccharibacteria bacterium]|nr:thermonuclease family protein [Candidatus Saccharibacteria bacterium]
MKYIQMNVSDYTDFPAKKYGPYGPRTALVMRVKDGDTILCRWYEGNVLTEHAIRFAGINAPEKSTDEGKRIARIIEERLKPNTFVHLDCQGLGNFGRVLATVYDTEGINICKWMLDKGYAVPY